MPASDKTKRAVWIKAAGRCAICREMLCVQGITSDQQHFLGDIAHIVAEESNGPRGASALSTEERNSEKNLLLLCLRHHKMVDDAPETYPAAALAKIADDHQAWVDANLAATSIWKTNFYHLQYINVPRLSLLAAMQGAIIDLSEFGDFKSLHELGWELNRLMAGFNNLLQKIQITAIPLDLAVETADPTGLLISCNHEFRTKNIHMPASERSQITTFTGNLNIDPHIYRKQSGKTIVANIDIRWITTTTAFCNFRPSGGKGKFAGLAFVNAYDPATKVLNITPFVLGMPSTPFLEALAMNLSTT